MKISSNILRKLFHLRASLRGSTQIKKCALVSVTERTREVGVRKALGATPLRIRQQFVIEAIVVCLLGGIAGIIFGVLIGNGISRLMSIKIFVVPWFWMFVGLLVCIFDHLSGFVGHKSSLLVCLS